MNPADDDVDWSVTTWEGSRRANIRQWLRLTVRERFEAVEAAGEFARFMASKREGEGSAEPGTRR
jgi:hypothetical protein